MTDHVIKKDYSEVLRQLEITDPVHINTLNPLFSRLINNDAYLKNNVDIINNKFEVEGITWNELRGMK